MPASVIPIGYLGRKFYLSLIVLQKKNDLKSVREMKTFVAEDLKNLKQQHKSLTLREFWTDILLFPDSFTAALNILFIPEFNLRNPL